MTPSHHSKRRKKKSNSSKYSRKKKKKRLSNSKFNRKKSRKRKRFREFPRMRTKSRNSRFRKRKKKTNKFLMPHLRTTSLIWMATVMTAMLTTRMCWSKPRKCNHTLSQLVTQVT
jgi:hypothetical protein